MGSAKHNEYEFIIVGAGASGSLLASRLAGSKKRPSVLLVEAGGKNDRWSDRIDAERWLHRMNPLQAWGYETTPQKNLDGRIISYDRGKGLGGSTAVNFSCYTIGPKDDHDEIARLADDEEWNWINAKERYKRIESYFGSTQDVPAGYEKYLDPKPEDHGHDGPIKVGFPKKWEETLKYQFDIWTDNGIAPNLDHNNGDPIGLAVCASSAHSGVRSTAADALVGATSNLHIMTDKQVARIICDGKKAVGITTLDGEGFLASKEIILSSGSLDTPRILMHSGIGPADQLKAFGIPVVKVNEHVGQHLKDHQHITPTWARAEHTSTRQTYYRSKKLQVAARALWEADQTGPLAEIACVYPIGFPKLDTIFKTREFQKLPDEVKQHILKPTIPTYEFILNGVTAEYFMDPDNTPAAATIFIFLMNLQSVGSVTLQSSDPKVPLLFDPNFFSHAYDRRLAIEATRDVLKVVNSPTFKKDTVGIISAPNSDSEEDILDFWRKTTSSTWHMTGTARMGKDEHDAVVDKDLKVFGVDNLRIADMSVIPILPK